MSDLVLTPGLPEIVEELVQQYNIVNLVETGTGPVSSGLQMARTLGLRGYSCDVYAPAVTHAREQFSEAKVYHGESLGFLAQILPTLRGATFFWLDGHCPTDPDDLPGPVFPPYEELLMIKALKTDYAGDVMWLDDIPMVDVEGNPVRTPWNVYLGGTGANWFGAKEHTWEEYMTVLAATHDAQVVDAILRYTPRHAGVWLT